MRDHLSWETTCLERPPVLRDRFYCAEWAVSHDRFYCSTISRSTLSASSGQWCGQQCPREVKWGVVYCRSSLSWRMTAVTFYSSLRMIRWCWETLRTSLLVFCRSLKVIWRGCGQEAIYKFLISPRGATHRIIWHNHKWGQAKVNLIARTRPLKVVRQFQTNMCWLYF